MSTAHLVPKSSSSESYVIGSSELLSVFLSAYEAPAAVLDLAAAHVLVHENGPFIALQHRYMELVDEFLNQLKTGSKRLTTEFGGRTIRWTITEYPRDTKTETRRVIVLAQPEEVEKGQPSSADTDTLLPDGPSLSRRTHSPRTSHLTPPPPTQGLPSSFEAFHEPSAISVHASPQSWLHKPRFHALASGIGEMGELVRTFDWSSTVLGHIHSWPTELVRTFELVLHCKSPASVIWGPDSIFLYNTAYVDILGPNRHPHALGQRMSDVWKELWAGLDPLISRALTGETLLFEDAPFLLHRLLLDQDGKEVAGIEEAFFTFNLVPIFLANGSVGGLYNPLMDTTMKKKSERRMSALCQLATRLVGERTTRSMMFATCDVLRSLEDDIPYAAAYTVSTENPPGGDPTVSPSVYPTAEGSHKITTFTLGDTIGIPSDTAAAPEKLVVDPDRPSTTGVPPNWAIDLANVVREHESSLHTNVRDMLVDLPIRGSISDHPTHAAVLPITSGDELVGCLIVYIGPGQAIDDRLNGFLDLLRRQLSTSASMVASYEQEVRKLEEMATLDRAKTSFFTNISHELRTPLTLILGPVRELLRSEKAVSSGARQQLGIVERNANRLLRLVNAIMEFATAQAGRLSATFRPTHLGSFTADLASIFRSAAEHAGLEYNVDTSRVPSGLVVWVDRDKYEKIVYNLLSNALKYTLAGSIAVSIHLDRIADRFVLEVRDSGIGIPSEELASVFDKFHRVTSTRGRIIEGTGIGLSYTRELVRIHKGDVTVESKLGEGSVFRISIPLGRGHLDTESVIEDSAPGEWSVTNPDDGNDEASASNSSMSLDSEGALDDVIWQPLTFETRSRARIIVVDDNADMRQYMVGLLVRYCDIFPCADGSQALAELQACPKDYDLVLSDDLMPHMSGPELLALLRADERLQNIPFIIISANAGDEARMSGLARGADDYLSKPFLPRELLLRIHTQLQSASIRNRLELQMAEHLRSLEESRDSFIRLCERLQVGIHRSDPDGAITWTNHKAKSTMGSNEEQWRNWGYKVHPDDRETSLRLYFTAIQTRAGYPKPVELRIRDPAVEDGWLDIIYDLQPEFSSGAGGDLLGWVGVWTDVSSLRKLQREVVEVERAHAAEADRSRELQEQFIDITCHELRNPLNAIYNSAALLGESLVKIDMKLNAMKDMDDAERLSTFKTIHAEILEDIESANTIVFCARHQKRITDDVLNVSKLSAGLMTLNPSNFDPCKEVENTVRMFRDQVSARDIQLHFEQDESINALQVHQVWGDNGRFIQVIVNLISNAIKFTEPAPRRVIRVRFGAAYAPEKRLESDEDEWPSMDQEDLLPMCRQSPAPVMDAKLRLYIAISDSGLGMADDEQVRLFQRFVQASPRTYGQFGGSGLGLYVSRMLVELQGGMIHLQSKQSVGTVLRFFITVQQVVAVPPTTSDETPSVVKKILPQAELTDTAEAANARRMHVLVVEDNMINQRLLAKLLANLGCETRTCSNGQECVDLLVSLARADSSVADARFDLVLMDLEMPVLDGLGATQRIRELEAQGVLKYVVPVVAVSGNARSEWTDHAREAGMNGFVRKPYSKEELDTLLKQWRPTIAISNT